MELKGDIEILQLRSLLWLPNLLFALTAAHAGGAAQMSDTYRLDRRRLLGCGNSVVILRNLVSF